MKPETARDASIDVIKAGASQLIVLHHIAFYGPMADAARPLAPGLLGWLGDPARIAVQAFLVIGGFLCAKAIAPGGALSADRPMRLITTRYMRLAPAFFAAMLVAIAGAAIARLLITHDTVPAAPTLVQLFVHTLLLHDLVGVDALSAGVWYVAIDFQLFALMLALLWVARGIGDSPPRRGWAGPAAVLGVAAASLFVFNRDAAFDVWALYFFGAYALGAFAYWTSTRAIPPAWLALSVACAVAALVVDFRSRIAVAIALALALAIVARPGFRVGALFDALSRTGVGAGAGVDSGASPRVTPGARLDGVVAYLGRISYAVFLVHFPVFLVVAAICSRLAGDDPAQNAAGMLIAWVASVAAGAAFHHGVERRLVFARAS